MSKIRRKIAETLVHAQQTAAILTTFNEVDLSEVINLRNKFREQFEKVYGVSLGFVSFFARATVLANFDWRQICVKIERIYDRLLGAPSEAASTQSESAVLASQER